MGIVHLLLCLVSCYILQLHKFTAENFGGTGYGGKSSNAVNAISNFRRRGTVDFFLDSKRQGYAHKPTVLGVAAYRHVYMRRYLSFHYKPTASILVCQFVRRIKRGYLFPHSVLRIILRSQNQLVTNADNCALFLRRYTISIWYGK